MFCAYMYSIMALFEGSQMVTVIISMFFMCFTICICKGKCEGNTDDCQLKKKKTTL